MLDFDSDLENCSNGKRRPAMRVLVNGYGNIGGTIVALLQRYQQLLGITEIHVLKNKPNPWDDQVLTDLSESGVNLHVSKPLEDIINHVDFVFDSTANGGALKNKACYENASHLLGCVSQGSETGFGVPFMGGVNDRVIADQKFVQVVSCNTHAILALLKKYSGGNLRQIENSDFVMVRRSEDIGGHERLVNALVVARHRDENGTHHAVDARRLLNTIGVDLPITSSDITTPAQLMHGVRFNITTSQPCEQSQETLIASTAFFDSNKLFELGRRKGFEGRLLNHAIVVDNNLLWEDKNVKGWAFIPQEGNTILSTIQAFLIQTHHVGVNGVMSQLGKDLVRQRY